MKFLLLGLVAIALVGCQDSPDYCKSEGYKGMVLYSLNNDGGYCSNGNLSPSGEYYETTDGLRGVETHTYFERKK